MTWKSWLPPPAVAFFVLGGGGPAVARSVLSDALFEAPVFPEERRLLFLPLPDAVAWPAVAADNRRSAPWDDEDDPEV